MGINNTPELINLEWDTEQLGIRCGGIDIRNGIDEQRLTDRILYLLHTCSDFELVSIKLPACMTGVVNRLIKGPADLIDTEYTYFFQNSPRNRGITDIQLVDCWNPAPFIPLATEMIYSRFYRDSNIPREKAQRLWRESIKNHCCGRAEKLAVAFIKGKEAGLVTVNLSGRQTAYLHIVGVLKDYRRSCIGKDLLAAVTKAFGSYHRIFVETSNCNIPANQLYQAAGFTICEVRYILHSWRKKNS